MTQSRSLPLGVGAQAHQWGTTAQIPLCRLFVALLPDAPARDAIKEAAAALRPGLPPGSRMIDAERFHLTVHFLGDSDGLDADREQAAIDACAGIHARAFDVRLDAFGMFEGKKPVGVLRSRQTQPGLLALHDALRKPLAIAGFGRWLEPVFEPHVTLFYGGREWPDQAITPISWHAGEFRLIRSVSGQRAHQTLGAWALVESDGRRSTP